MMKRSTKIRSARVFVESTHLDTRELIQFNAHWSMWRQAKGEGCCASNR